MKRGALEFASQYFTSVDTLVEVGVQTGMNALAMYNALNPRMMYLVDRYVVYTPQEIALSKLVQAEVIEGTWDQAQLDKYKSMAMAVVADTRHEFLFEESRVASLHVPDELDMVYLDATHDECNVLVDIACWWPKVRIGGIMSGHDYKSRDVNPKPGVQLAVDHIFGKVSSGRGLDGQRGGLDWWVVKHAPVYSADRKERQWHGFT